MTREAPRTQVDRVLLRDSRRLFLGGTVLSVEDQHRNILESWPLSNISSVEALFSNRETTPLFLAVTLRTGSAYEWPVDLSQQDNMGALVAVQFCETVRAARVNEDNEASIRLAQELTAVLAAEDTHARYFDCLVCSDTKPIDGAFTGECGHRTCRECMRNYILSKLADRQVVEEQLRCVHGCGCELTVPEVIGTLKAFGLCDAADQFVALRTNFAIQTDGSFCCCPRCKTSHFRTASEASGPGFPAICRHCRHRFCSRCNAARSHFLDGLPVGAECDEFMRSKHAAWLQWQAVGQAAYLTELSKIDEEYSQRLRLFEIDTAARAAALDAFQRDEIAKAAWVHCPNCNSAWAGTGAFAFWAP